MEDQPSAVQAVAAYVDLNGVRAGLLKDPKEYRDRFGVRRRDGARPMRGVGALGELATMRDLQVNGVG